MIAVGSKSWRSEKLGPAGSPQFQDWLEFAGIEGSPEVRRTVFVFVDDATVGRTPQAGSLLFGRGESEPRVFTERSDRPWVALEVCVM